MVDLGPLLEESGAILHGHFLLTSGRHSAVYFEKFRILERPAVLSKLCEGVAQHFVGKVDLVAGPLTGGIIIAFEVARQMGLPSIYVETEDGHKVLRRGAQVKRGARVLVVDDVLTTGLSVRETKLAITRAGGVVAGVGILIDRSGDDVHFGCEHFSSYKVAAESFPPDDVPAWLSEIPVTKPGSRAPESK